MMKHRMSTRISLGSLLLLLWSISLVVKEVGAGTVATPCTTAGKPNANANACEDDPRMTGARDCVRLFGTPSGGTNVARKDTDLPQDTCTAEANKLNAAHCRFTCATCCLLPEHECEDDKAPIVPCTKANCKDATKKKWMDIYCRSTCGLCAMPQAEDPLRPNCIDRINCAPFKKSCKDPAYVEEMKRSCARTCDYCSTVANVTNVPVSGTTLAPMGVTYAPMAGDTATNCRENVELCNNVFYRQIMLDSCAGTCRNVTGTTGTATVGRDINDMINEIGDPDCVDSNRNCATWDRRFAYCDSTFYTSASKEDTCSKTCGYC